MRIQWFTLVILSVFLAACSDNDMPDGNQSGSVDCERLIDGFLSDTNQYEYTVLDSICQTLPPMPTNNDPLGHLSNTNMLVETINQCAGIQLELTCYGCLESFPVQSSFRVQLDSLGSTVERFFTLFVPEDDVMRTN